MKIGIISDSHYNLKAIDNAICLAGEMDYWFHAGDSIDDAAYLESVTKKPVFKVVGNIDWCSPGPKEVLTEIAGKRIYMTHGHLFGVKMGLDTLSERAEQVMADVIIYGHSHVGLQKQIGDKLFLNPGSVTEPRDNLAPSFMIMQIENGEINVQRIFLK